MYRYTGTQRVYSGLTQVTESDLHKLPAHSLKHLISKKIIKKIENERSKNAKSKDERVLVGKGSTPNVERKKD